MRVSLEIPVIICVSIASTCSIVTLNKSLFQVYDFHYGTALTALHFAVTFMCHGFAAYLGLFVPKQLAVLSVLPMALSFCSTVVFNNLSLMHNSVGFYQAAKLMTIPTLVMIQSTIQGVSFSKDVKMSLIVLLVGIGITTITDVQFNMIGAGMAILAIGTTAIYNIGVGTTQKKLGVTSQQLLLYQAPIASTFLAVTTPFLDDFSGLRSYPFSIPSVSLIVLSAFVSYSVNLTTFLLISKTSPVTYQVVGHAKTIIIFIIGFAVFGTPVRARNVMGIVIAIAGMTWYTYLKISALPKGSIDGGSSSSSSSGSGNGGVKAMTLTRSEARQV